MYMECDSATRKACHNNMDEPEGMCQVKYHTEKNKYCMIHWCVEF